MLVLVIEVAGQLYGLPATDVQEVVRAVAVVTLPEAPPVVEGVINLRGAAVPVLDIRARFRLPSKPPAVSDHFVIARAKGRPVVVRADRAVELTEIADRQIEDAEKIVPGARYVSGVAAFADRLALIHDLSTFLSRAESERLEETLKKGPGT